VELPPHPDIAKVLQGTIATEAAEIETTNQPDHANRVSEKGIAAIQLFRKP